MLQRITLVITFPSIQNRYENESCSIMEKWFHRLKDLQIIPAEEVASTSLLVKPFRNPLL